MLDEHPNVVLGNSEWEVGSEPVEEPRHVSTRLFGRFGWRRDCDWLHQCMTDTGIRSSRSLIWLRRSQSPSFAAGICRNFCFTRNRPLLGPHSES